MSELTKLTNMIDPEVLADMIAAKVEKGITALPYAKVDTTLVGQPGSTITVPQFVWDGEAVIVPEGEDIPLRALGTKSAQYPIHKAGIGTAITDEAALSGYGDVMGAAADGIYNSIYGKMDEDAVGELYKANTISESATFGYDAIVDGVDKFNEENNKDKVMLVPPALVSVLRKDDDFVDKTHYGNDVMVTGEIGMVANTRIRPSRRVEGVGGYFYSPIIETSDEGDAMPALTYFLKRDTNIEVERVSRKRTTEITGDQMYIVALTNDSKVVLVKVPGAAIKIKPMYEDEYKYPGTNVTLENSKITGKATGSISGSTAAYTVKFNGKAKKLSATDRAALSFDESATHYINGCIEIPGAGISEDAPTVTWGGATVSAAEMRKIGQAWYADFVGAVKESGGAVVLASGQSTLPTMVCGGITTTFTPNFDGVTLEA